MSDGDKQDCGVMGTTQVVIIVIVIIIIILVNVFIVIIIMGILIVVINVLYLLFKEQCESSGCCWRPVASSTKVSIYNKMIEDHDIFIYTVVVMIGQIQDTPWCYYPGGDGPGPGGDCDNVGS